MAECLWDAGVLSSLQLSRKLLGQRPALGLGIISGNSGAKQEGFFSQTLAEASSGQGALTACRGSTQVNPDSSSAQLHEEFIPMGSARKCDVSSHGFLTGAVPLHPKNTIPPCVSLASFAYHTSSTYTYMHIWSPSVGKKGGGLRSHIAQCCTVR